MTSDSDARVVDAFERLPELVAHDHDLLRRGAYLTVEFMVEIGSVPFYLSIVGGRLVGLERGPKLMRPWSFAIRATIEAWSRFWQPTPQAGWHDIFALMKRQEARVERGICAPLWRIYSTLKTFSRHLAAYSRRADYGREIGTYRWALCLYRNRRPTAPSVF